METKHTAVLHRQWDDFEHLCAAARNPLSKLQIAFQLSFGDLKTVGTTVGVEVARQRTQISEFQCPLCRAVVGAECFANRLGECPRCRFPHSMPM